MVPYSRRWLKHRPIAQPRLRGVLRLRHNTLRTQWHHAHPIAVFCRSPQRRGGRSRRALSVSRWSSLRPGPIAPHRMRRARQVTGPSRSKAASLGPSLNTQLGVPMRSCPVTVSGEPGLSTLNREHREVEIGVGGGGVTIHPACALRAVATSVAAVSVASDFV